jgi:aldehyde:ferredoxin oxidoreductase
MSTLGARWNVSAKSPHTGILGDANSGGHFGAELKFAGYDQIIFEGKSEEPVYILISGNEVRLCDAKNVWGQDTHQSTEIMKQELGDPSISVAVCGPAAENGVSFCGVFADKVRAAARTGMGTVMASKNLKAVAVRGNGHLRVAQPDKWMDLSHRLEKRILAHPDFWSRSVLGTPRNVSPLSEEGFLVTKHFQTGHFPGADNMSGEALGAKYNVKNKSCFGCPIHCSRYFVVRQGPFAGLHGEGPEYEAMAGFGSRVLIDDLGLILRANDMCNRYGLDAITTSEVISWAMECNQRGMLSRQEADGLDLSWGNKDTVLTLIEKIAKREGFGDFLADGVRAAADRLGQGSEEIAMHVKGLEMIQAEPRGMKGYALTFATATRGGDHLRSEPYFELVNDPKLGEERFGIPETALRLEYKGKGTLVAYFKDWCAVSDALNVCKNTMVCMDMMDFEGTAEALRYAVGWDIGAEEVQKIGERIYNLERCFGVREGMRREDDRLPRRFLEEPLPPECGPSAGQVVELEPMLDEFYRQSGWDPQNGIPLPEKLDELDLHDVNEDMEEYR